MYGLHVNFPLLLSDFDEIRAELLGSEVFTEMD